jgi:hypothetical protein
LLGFIYITRSEASRLIMAGYSYTSNQFTYNEPKVQFANTLPMSNVSSYFASTMNPYVDVARFDTSRHIASASNYSDDVNYTNYNSEFNMQKPLLNNMHALNFNDTSNIQRNTGFKGHDVAHVFRVSHSCLHPQLIYSFYLQPYYAPDHHLLTPQFLDEEKHKANTRTQGKKEPAPQV